MVIKILIIILIVLAAFPIGVWIAWLSRDELKDSRKWYVVSGIVCLLFSLIALLFREIEIFVSLLFLSIVSGVSWWKSFDAKFIVPWGKLD